MLKALYYPHTQVRDPIILKNALLLWDELETIVPKSGWRPAQGATTRVVAEAIELIVKPRVPTASERRAAHASIVDFMRSMPSNLLLSENVGRWQRTRYSNPRSATRYLIYPEKFLDETWSMLSRVGLAESYSRNADYGVPPTLGFMMMSLLADACAGTQIQKVTDRVDAYGWIGKHNASLLGSQYIRGLDVSEVASTYDRLVSLSLEVIDARCIPLKKLVDMRKREQKGSGSNYTALRRHYLKALNAHIKLIATQAKTAGDIKELERQFRGEIKQDLDDLKYELGVSGIKTLLSKEVGISAVIAAGALIAAVPGLTTLAQTVSGLGIIPLLGSAINYKSKKREILRKHAMSWLYLGTRKPLSIY